MNVLADLRAAQVRIAEISGSPAPTSSAPHKHRFDTLVSANVERIVNQSARASGLDPALVRAVVQAESGFDPRATSATGAAGLMQLMPATAQAKGITDPYDPAQNALAGASYLRELLDRFHGDLRLGLAAYNAGPALVQRYGGVPPFLETQTYVTRVMDAYRSARVP